MPRQRRWPLMFAWLDAASPAASLLIVAALLAATWLFMRTEASELSVWNHLYYLPIVLTAIRFGASAAAGTGLVAGFLAGPGLVNVEPGIWVPRAAAFVVVGGVVGALASARAEASRREREVAERESALVAQRASLIQLVSHEFRTPLTVIRGSFETLRNREDAIAEPYRELLTATERSIDRLQEMVDVVLAAADELDTGAAPRTLVDVGRLVRHVAGSLDDELAGELELRGCEGVEVVTVEPYLWLAARCLLDNVRKFALDGGSVVVTCVEEAGWVELSIADRGPGLPEGLEESLFEPFLQVDASERRTHQGLGMGLYTARRLARRLGGDVGLRSEPAAGTTATIIFPARGDGPWRDEADEAVRSSR